jgi:hypothetical protein
MEGGIKNRGFQPDLDRKILDQLYGVSEHLRTTIEDDYESSLLISELTEEEREAGNYPSPQECVAYC